MHYDCAMSRPYGGGHAARFTERERRREMAYHGEAAEAAGGKKGCILDRLELAQPPHVVASSLLAVILGSLFILSRIFERYRVWVCVKG